MKKLLLILLCVHLIFSCTINPKDQNVLEVFPKSSSKDQKQNDNIEVHINKDIEFYYIDNNDEKVKVKNISELEKRLTSLLSDVVDPGITLYCDKTVPADRLVKVMDIAYINSWKFEIATEE